MTMESPIFFNHQPEKVSPVQVQQLQEKLVAVEAEMGAEDRYRQG